METFSRIVAAISWLSVIVPLVVLPFRRSCLQVPLYLLLATLLLISFLSDLVLHMSNTDDRVVSIIFYGLQFIVVSMIFCCILEKWQTVIVITGIIFIGYLIYAAVVFPDAYYYQVVPQIIGSAVLTLYGCGYIKHLFSTMPTTTLECYSPFWINTGLLIYYGFNFFVLGLNALFVSHAGNDEIANMLITHNLNNVIKNLLFAWAILQSGRQHLNIREIVSRQFT